ncbi:MAG: EAL domain-containing protein [Methylophilaceae bacterium]|nr:EAL domain-containing protein [Methylophilaceae bacterium]
MPVLFKGLRDKMLAVMAMRMFILFGAQYFIASHVILGRYVAVEESVTAASVRRVMEVLQENRLQLDSLASDWDGWDDAYRFLKTRDKRFIASNFTPSTFERLDIDGVAIVTMDGTVLYRAFRAADGSPALAPSPLIDLMGRGGLLLQFSETRPHVSGLLPTPQGNLMVSSFPVTTSDGRGPVLGAMIMVRHLQGPLISRLSAISHVNFTLLSVDSPHLTQAAKAAVLKLKKAKQSVFVQAIDEHRMGGYALLSDLLGRPSVLLQVMAERDYFAQGQVAVNYMVWTSLLIVIVLGLASWLFESGFLSRLSLLSRTVQRIGDSQDVTIRIPPVSGRDELSRLAENINDMLERLEASQLRLRESEARHLAIFSSRSVIKFFLDPASGVIVEANPAASSFLGLEASRLAGMKLGDFVIEDDRARFMEAMAEHQTDIAFRIRPNHGEVREIELHPSPLTVEGRQMLYAIAFDVTERRQFEKALNIEKERAQTTLASIADAVLTIDEAGRIIFLNGAAERLIGLDSSEAYGRPTAEVIRLFDAESQQPLESGWLTEMGSTLSEAVVERPDGERFVVTKSTAELRENDVCVGVVTVLHDVTALRALSKQLSYQASHDALTGLVNRYEFERLAQHALADAKANQRIHCVAYIDLDQFKVVNDSCGHLAGDVLLRQIAEQMRARVRDSDSLARLGGDEFGLLLMGCRIDDAQNILDQVLRAIREYRFTYDGKMFKIGASIGLTEIDPEQTGTLSELLTTVDSACYAAKEDGGNRIHVYQANDQELRTRYSQLEWVSRIHEGLEKGLFRIYSQSMRALTPGGEAHCELLIRMHAEDGTIYSPGYFLPAAERYHLMPQIDRWVVKQAIATLARRKGVFAGVCAINLSGQTLSEEDFLDFVTAEIAANRLDARCLCFEITESAMIANLNKARQFIQTLRQMGCRFSLDDFGSGLSSFGYLKTLDVDFLKIDGMFIKNITQSQVDRAMVESINHIGHVMGLHTIAEFAEDDATIAVLAEIGIDYAQGYGVAKPELFI